MRLVKVRYIGDGPKAIAESGRDYGAIKTGDTLYVIPGDETSKIFKQLEPSTQPPAAKPIEHKWPCQHFGEKVGEQKSKCCGDRESMIPVHTCNLLNVECSRQRLPDVRHCLLCEHGPYAD